MIDLLILCLCNAFAIAGFHLSTQEGMILHFIRRMFESIPSYIKGGIVRDKWYHKLIMPLYDCPTCMASIHSTYFFIPFAIIHDPTLLYIYPLYILTLAGISTLVYRLIDCLEDKLL